MVGFFSDADDQSHGMLIPIAEVEADVDGELIAAARTALPAALDEIDRLRAGIKALIAGDEHKPHPTMKDKCVHECWSYSGVCDLCQEEYLQKLLDGELK